MIFETHAHYDDNRFNDDRNELLQSMKDKNVGCIVNICADMKSVEPVIKLTKEYDFIYGSVGVHPDETQFLTENDIEVLRHSASDKKIVAIGEIGLDYYGESVDKEIQKKWFIAQLNLAKELDLPVVIHSRDALEDTMSILNDYNGRCVMHCFSYSKEIAQILVKKDFYIGVGGVITFKNSKKLKESVEAVPLENILLETDCPYLAPEPFRGTRNDSSLIKYVVEKIAEIKNVSPQTVEDITWNNALSFYNKISL